MNNGNLILGANSVTVSYLICYDSLLQNTTDIIRNATAILLQNATEFYYKMRQVFHYKMRQLYYQMRNLQIGTNLFQNATIVTKRDVYYKLRRYTMFLVNI